MSGARMSAMRHLFLAIMLAFIGGHASLSQQVAIPAFSKLKANYMGYAHHGGDYHHYQLIKAVGVDSNLLLQDDTSALRLSATLNKIGGAHSLGKEPIRLSKFGHDSVPGNNGLQYIYHPIAYGPYLADKYGYPTVTKLHEMDPLDTKKNFWGKQGILRVITYTDNQNLPKGHVALWDCNHFHQAPDWIAKHNLVTVEFWESPDSFCNNMPPMPQLPADYPKLEDILPPNRRAGKRRHHRHMHWEEIFVENFIKKLMTKSS
ncbi:uncharacterized protein LOC129922109 isoform X1 [Biomphalaria glabrata]|uniref:Uncharacterized protein LOC129922109 isoform X1 n=2 Tax=Biomphalaria glabrata TaxID=6526 RepID=A0A9W2YJ00_BIOGL|nr:uncharacterized protein LOC129922109 isoform X1 [Biomphalaria glabrata]